MNRKYKHIYKISILMFLLLLITGCGKIKSEKQVLKQAKKQFGEAEVISKNEQDAGKVVYSLKDKQYGFAYNCVSAMTEFGMDGTTFFTYPSVVCTFDIEYKTYLLNKIQNDNLILDNELSISLSTKYQTVGGIEIASLDLYTNEFNLGDIYISILDQLKAFDDRNYYNYFELDIYDYTTKEKIGTINSKDNKLLTNAVEEEKWFTEYANSTFSKSGQSNAGEIELLRVEENIFIKNYDEIYNKLYKNATVEEREKLETATMKMYYFYDNVANDEFYMIDYYIMGQPCYYNNYKSTIRNEFTKNICKPWWN